MFGATPVPVALRLAPEGGVEGTFLCWGTRGHSYVALTEHQGTKRAGDGVPLGQGVEAGGAARGAPARSRGRGAGSRVLRANGYQAAGGGLRELARSNDTQTTVSTSPVRLGRMKVDLVIDILVLSLRLLIRRKLGLGAGIDALAGDRIVIKDLRHAVNCTMHKMKV